MGTALLFCGSVVLGALAVAAGVILLFKFTWNHRVDD